MHPRHLIGLLCLGLLPGCVGSLCRGAGCEDVYPAGQILLMGTPFAATETARPATALDALSGTVDHGTNWTPAGFGGALFIGLPEVGRVIRWRPVLDDADDVSDTTVLNAPGWRGPWNELGAQVAPFDPGNGRPDLWVSAPGANLDRGLAVLWLSARTGTEQDEGRPVDAAHILHGQSPTDRLGEQLRVCPDLTGDGVPDLLLAAPRMSTELETGIAERAGAVFLVPSELQVQVGDQLERNHPFESWSAQSRWWNVPNPEATLGSSLACGHDLTGDGVPDIVIGAPGMGENREGALWILSGADLPASGALGAPTAVGSVAGLWFGSALSTGDLDGDDIGDLAVGAAGANAGAGEVHMFYGPEMTLARTVIVPTESSENTHLGRDVLIADIDDNGFAELVLGAEDWLDGDDFDAGRLGIWQGSATRLSPNSTFGTDEDFALTADHAFQRLGGSMAEHELGLVLAVRSRGF